MKILFGDHELKIEDGKNAVLLSDFGISEDGSSVYLDNMHCKKIGYEMEGKKLKEPFCRAAKLPITEEKLFNEYQQELKKKKIDEQLILLLNQRDSINDIQSKEDVEIINEKEFSDIRILEFRLKEKMKIMLTIVGLKNDDNTSKILAKVLHEDVSDIKFETELNNLCDEKNYTRIKNAFIYHSKDKLKLLYK